VLDDAAILDAAPRLGDAAHSPARVLLVSLATAGIEDRGGGLVFLVIERQVSAMLAELVHLRDALLALGVPVDVLVVSGQEAARRRRSPRTPVHRAPRTARCWL
jgi:hypothetical protein